MLFSLIYWLQELLLLPEKETLLSMLDLQLLNVMIQKEMLFFSAPGEKKLMTSRTMVNTPELGFWIVVLNLQLCKSVQNFNLFRKPQNFVSLDAKELTKSPQEERNRDTEGPKHLTKELRRHSPFVFLFEGCLGQVSYTHK